jgi:NDP-sugar pyrophosphorylase family protein
MQCLVLAGGFGRRMLPYTEDVPKYLLPVAGHPFADWQLSWLAADGIERVVLCVGYRGDLVRRYVGDGSRFGLDVHYVDEGADLLGTGGALRLAVEQEQADSTFFVLYGDSYLPIHLREVEEAYACQRAPVLMTVYRDTAGLERPNAVFDGSMVTHYEKGLIDPLPQMRHVDYGLSVWQRRIVESLVPMDEVVDMAELFTRLSLSGELAGWETRQRFYEIGSREGLSELDSFLRAGGAAGNPPNPDR